MTNSAIYNFFFADFWRTIIIIIIIIATILFLAVLGKTIFIPDNLKFKLVFIIMINVMITAILNPLSYFFNWVVYEDGEDTNGTLLFGNGTDFLCQFQSAAISSTQSSRETFVTLISVISFISFKFEDLRIDNNRLCVIIVLLIGYLIPITANIIYYYNGMLGKTQYFCFITDKIWGIIHMAYVLILVIISIIFISYLIIKTTNSNKEKEFNPWGDDTQKYCIHPHLKKIIFFPLAQIFTNSFPLIFRFMDYIKQSNYYSKLLARPAATLNSVSSILYTLIFAITNDIFTKTKNERESSVKSGNKSVIQLLES